MESRKKVESFKVNMYQDGQPTASQAKGADGKVAPDAYRSATAQAADIKTKMIATQGDVGGKVGITYSANHDQTAALRAYYRGCDSTPPADAATQAAAWNAVITAFDGAGAQGKVMQKFLASLSEAQKSEFRILPITTMAPDGSATKPEWLQQDMQNINDFSKNGNVLGWQNEDATDEHKFAVGGNIAGAAYTPADDAYVQSHLKALEQTANENDPIPPVNPHPGAGKSDAPRRESDDKRIKQLEANAREWAANNPGRSWTPIGNYMPSDGSDENPDMLPTIGAGNKDVKSPLKRTGYYKTDGQGNEDNAYIKFNAEDMSVKPIKKGWHAITYKDHVNGCDFLAAQGVRSILFDYNQASAITKSMASDTVKIMMSQIYEAGWEKHVDKNGNVLPGHEDKLKFREPPVAMRLGGNLHDYIDRHIGAIDNKLFGKQAAKLCLRMLELERISAARLQNAPVPAGPAPDAAIPPAPPAFDPPPPIVRHPEPGPVEDAPLVAQNAGDPEAAAAVERQERLAAAAKRLGEAMGGMADNLDNTTPAADAPKSGFFANLEHQGADDAFTQDELKEIKGIGMQIEKIPGLNPEDKQALKNILIEYVAASRADGAKDPVRAEMVKDKFNELAVKASKSEDKAGVNQLQMLDGKFDKAAPEQTSRVSMNK